MSTRPHCVRCDRWFGKPQDLQQHLRNSSFHNKCPRCAFDGYEWEDLIRHSFETGHSMVCRDCNNAKGKLFDPDNGEWDDHVYEYNMCESCGYHFYDDWDLEIHQEEEHSEGGISSEDEDEDENDQCPRCEKSFHNTSGMIQHLESGACSSEVDVYDIKQWCVQCDNWVTFVIPTYYRSMRMKMPVLGEQYPFKCPECAAVFARFSGLLQHAEGRSCRVSVHADPLRRALEFVVGQMGNARR